MTPETQTFSPAPRADRCCARFDPAPWQGRELRWKDRPFVVERVRSVLHIPLNFAAKVREARILIDAANAAAPNGLMLVDERSAWHSDLYVPVTGPVPGAEMAWLSGTFITKVFEGPYRDAPEWAAIMGAYIAGRGRTLSKLYYGYTTCPACSRAYGENHVVMFAQVADAPC